MNGMPSSCPFPSRVRRISLALRISTTSPARSFRPPFIGILSRRTLEARLPQHATAPGSLLCYRQENGGVDAEKEACFCGEEEQGRLDATWPRIDNPGEC